MAGLNEKPKQGTEAITWLPVPGGGRDGRLGPDQLVQVWDSLGPDQGRSQKPSRRFLCWWSPPFLLGALQLSVAEHGAHKPGLGNHFGKGPRPQQASSLAEAAEPI